MVADLAAAAEQLNSCPLVAPTPLEVIHARARTLRRRRHGAVGAAIATVAVTVAAVWLPDHRPARSVRVAAAPTTVVPLGAVTPPSTVLVRLPSGQIGVLDTATGQQQRALAFSPPSYGSVWGMHSFHVAPDGQSIYVSGAIATSSVSTPLLRVPLGGGSPTTIGTGLLAAPSTDGSLVLVREGAPGVWPNLHVMTVRAGTRRDVPSPVGFNSPTGANGEVVTSVTWARGTHELVAITTTPSPCQGPPGFHCPVPTTVGPEPAAQGWTLDLDASTSTWARRPPVSGRQGGWAALEFIGPGRLNGSVLAADITTGVPGSTTAGLPRSLLTIAVDGVLIDTVAVPSGVNDVLNVDRSGTNVLVDTSGGLARIALADPIPHLLAPAHFADAAW